LKRQREAVRMGRGDKWNKRKTSGRETRDAKGRRVGDERLIRSGCTMFISY
jgi:hypothetical protein